MRALCLVFCLLFISSVSVCPVAAELVENPYQADLSASGNDGYFVTDEYSVSADVAYHVDAEEVYHVEAAAYVTPADAYTGETAEYAVDIDEYIITPSVNGYPYWTFWQAFKAVVGIVGVIVSIISIIYGAQPASSCICEFLESSKVFVAFVNTFLKEETYSTIESLLQTLKSFDRVRDTFVGRYGKIAYRGLNFIMKHVLRDNVFNVDIEYFGGVGSFQDLPLSDKLKNAGYEHAYRYLGPGDALPDIIDRAPVAGHKMARLFPWEIDEDIR